MQTAGERSSEHRNKSLLDHRRGRLARRKPFTIEGAWRDGVHGVVVGTDATTWFWDDATALQIGRAILEAIHDDD